MYERFGDRARKVMQLANQETQRFNDEYIGTEHILLGLVKEGAGVAANVLKNLDIDLRKIRLQVERIIRTGPDIVVSFMLPLTPRAKKAIEYAIAEARSFKHDYVGTEHLLLGLLREQEGVAAQVLMNLGLKLEDVREELLNVLGWANLGPAATWRDIPESEEPDLPWELKQAMEVLEAQIEQLNQEKESAVAEQNFEKATHLRDQADKLKEKKDPLLRQWCAQHAVDPSWLTKNEGQVASLARSIGTERRWQDLPLLAEALEKAGCTDQEILDHCRWPGKHHSQCWVVDLLLDVG
jgi:ATP-dependent Clp protease ATP-binding subunit ClpA